MIELSLYWSLVYHKNLCTLCLVGWIIIKFLMPFLIPIVVVATAGLGGVGVYWLKTSIGNFGKRIENHVGKVADKTEDTLEGVLKELKNIAREMMKFITLMVWPRVLTILHILQVYILMLIISLCDTFAKAETRSSYEALLAKVTCYSCWMFVLYFLFKILIHDILLRVNRIHELVVVILLTIFAVLLPFWEVFQDDFHAYVQYVHVLVSSLFHKS